MSDGPRPGSIPGVAANSERAILKRFAATVAVTNILTYRVFIDLEGEPVIDATEMMPRLQHANGVALLDIKELPA